MFVEDLNFHRNHFAALKSKDDQMKQKLPSDSALHLSDTNPVCRRESAGGAITNLFIKRLWCSNNERSCWRCLASFVSVEKCCCGIARNKRLFGEVHFVVRSKHSLLGEVLWKIVFVTYERRVASVALLECLLLCYVEAPAWQRRFIARLALIINVAEVFKFSSPGATLTSFERGEGSRYCGTTLRNNRICRTLLFLFTISFIAQQ